MIGLEEQAKAIKEEKAQKQYSSNKYKSCYKDLKKKMKCWEKAEQGLCQHITDLENEENDAKSYDRGKGTLRPWCGTQRAITELS